MATPQEIEIKFLVPDLKALAKKLEELGFKRETPSTHEINTLYDLPGQKLRRKGEILRLRKYGDKWKLTHKSKGKAGRHKSRAESETAFSDGKQMDNDPTRSGICASVSSMKSFVPSGATGRARSFSITRRSATSPRLKASRAGSIALRAHSSVDAKNYITKSYGELFLDWKRRTRCKAKNMTFREYGECMKAAKKSASTNAQDVLRRAASKSGSRPR